MPHQAVTCIRISPAGFIAHSPDSDGFFTLPYSSDMALVGKLHGRTVYVQYADSEDSELLYSDFRQFLTGKTRSVRDIFFKALALKDFATSQTYSPFTGEQSNLCPGDGSWKRVDSVGNEVFPRIDPVVLVLVLDPAGDALLVNNNEWDTKRFAPISGYVDTGESLEQCATREIHEEVGISTSADSIEYVCSGPWPSPNLLTVGMVARINDKPAPVVQTEEIRAARWFSVSDVRDLRNQADVAKQTEATKLAETMKQCKPAALQFPSDISVGGQLLTKWVNGAFSKA